MRHDLEEMLAAAREVPRTAADEEEQRRSFAYGNAHIENEDVTRAMVDEAAEKVSPRR